MVSDWRTRYKDKVVPAARAVSKIRAGSRVFIGSACGEPQSLVRAMCEVSGGLTDTELIHVLTLGVAPYTDPKYAANFRANAFFIGNSLRDAVNQARADYTPVFLSQVPALFKSQRVPIDTALVMVSPPDEHGFCSLGVSVDITKSAVESAKLVIAQVNRHMPRVGGDSFINVEQIDCLVEQDEPLLEWPVSDTSDETIRKIAGNVARLISDGATLQLGIGRIPDVILQMLTDRHDLGIHTEMFSDGVMKLVKAGNITGKAKTLDQGKIVGSFATGTRELFDFMHNNPQIEMHPSDYTNRLEVISLQQNMVAINSALEIDLTGQVCADSIGERLFSGIGGHADFIRGAALAKNGKPVIALPSTAVTPDGRRSRITADLSEGASVTTTRGDVHYIVTEYGIAYLHGKNLRERAMALINIAHPDYRSDLLYAAKRRHLVYRNQIMPSPARSYPSEYETTMTTHGDERIFVRPIRPDDEPEMKEMFYSFSEKTVYLRYHNTLKSMPHNRLQVFCNVDYDTEIALVATVGQAGHEDVVAVARYMTDPAKETAEMAFVVRDDYQRKGIGTFLFEKLVEIARSQGIRRFHAEVLAENSGMLKIFYRSGLKVETSSGEGVISVNLELPEPVPAT